MKYSKSFTVNNIRKVSAECSETSDVVDLALLLQNKALFFFSARREFKAVSAKRAHLRASSGSLSSADNQSAFRNPLEKEGIWSMSL